MYPKSSLIQVIESIFCTNFLLPCYHITYLAPTDLTEFNHYHHHHLHQQQQQQQCTVQSIFCLVSLTWVMVFRFSVFDLPFFYPLEYIHKITREYPHCVFSIHAVIWIKLMLLYQYLKLRPSYWSNFCFCLFLIHLISFTYLFALYICIYMTASVV